MIKILKSAEVQSLLSTVKRRGRPISAIIKAFDSLKVGQGFKTNRKKSLQCRIRAYKERKKVMILNIGRNCFLVIRKA
jgi:hypothetical protein